MRAEWALTAAIVLLVPILTLAREDARSIVQKAVAANQRDWAAAPQFDYTELDRDENGTKTYAVTTLFGSPYERLIAENGHPLSASKAAQEQKKFEQEVAKRRHESPSERSARVAKYEAERKRDHTMMEQLTSAFDFQLTGEQKMKGHTVYVLTATPRKGYKPPDRDSEVLTGMQGTLWIDKDSFQWVKVEAHVIHPVTIEGFLAKVERGTKFELEKIPVTPDIWLPSHFSMKANAKVFFVFSKHSQEDEIFSNYHKRQNQAAD